MPLLTYTSSDFPFQPFTKIYSADLNQCYNDIKTLLNTTGLDDTNIQNLGISATKLKAITAGYFLGSNGTNVLAVPNPLQQQFNVIIGSAAQVTAGTATHSAYATYSASAADGDRILILPAYATAENWTIAKKLYIQGLGDTSQIQGTITFATGANYAYLAGIRTTATVVLNSTVSGVLINGIWLANSSTFTDNGTGNLVTGIQE